LLRDQDECVVCDVLSESALDKTLIEGADFSDAYRASLRRPKAGVIEIFFASFAHRPVWMNLLLIARNKVAGFAGFETPTTSELLNIEKRDRYIVGQKIGPWPIFLLVADELIAGRDNKHMDFRLSIMKVRVATAQASSCLRCAWFTIPSGGTPCPPSLLSTNLVCAN
jgi:Protein of unknown function (DUF2867)